MTNKVFDTLRKIIQPANGASDLKKAITIFSPLAREITRVDADSE